MLGHTATKRNRAGVEHHPSHRNFTFLCQSETDGVKRRVHEVRQIRSYRCLLSMTCASVLSRLRFLHHQSRLRFLLPSAPNTRRTRSRRCRRIPSGCCAVGGPWEARKGNVNATDFLVVSGDRLQLVRILASLPYSPAKDRGGPLFKAFIREYTETSNLCREVMRYCR